QRLSIFRGDLRLQRVIERPAPQSGVPALAVATKVRAPTGLLAGRVDLDPVRRSDEPDQLALRTCLTAGDAGPLWDLTNAWAAAAGFRLRPGGGLAHSPPPTLLATRAAPACAGGWPKPRHEAGLMSIRQPVSFAARRAFWPPRPIASDSCASGTITVAVLSASLSSTWSTFAGPRAFATKAAGSGCHWMTSICSPFSSRLTLSMRTWRGLTHEPTGSTPSWRAYTATLVREPGSRAIAFISTTPLNTSGTSSSNSRRTRFRCVRDTITCGPFGVRLTSTTYTRSRWFGR